MARFTSQSYVRPLAVGLIAACVLALTTALFQTGIVGASGETAITFVPVGSVRAGQLITVKIMARNAHDLAGFQSTVRYDAAGLRLTGASVANGLGRGGRGVLPLGSVMGDGAVALGAATCAVGACTESQGAGLFQSNTGVSGEVELGVLEIYSDTPGKYNLSFEGVKFVDAQGNPLEVRSEGLALEVRPK